MNTENTKNSAPTNNPAVRKKISVKQIKLSDMDVGFKFSGKFLQFTKGQEFTTVDTKGELITKALQFALFEDEKGERISYVADKGLVDAITLAGVTTGQKIEVIKLPKAAIGKGRTMNQYDIFSLAN
ncbi:MAG: hypothetical protein AB7T49_21625 [Oligoflexales bacterium]